MYIVYTVQSCHVGPTVLCVMCYVYCRAGADFLFFKESSGFTFYRKFKVIFILLHIYFFYKQFTFLKIFVSGLSNLEPPKKVKKVVALQP